MKMKKNIIIGIGIMVALLMVPFVSAFGVSTPHWDGNPLGIRPGDTTDLVLTLQNMVGNEDMTLRAVLVEGSEIAQIVDSNTDYFVPYGSKDVEVHLKVSIPANAQLGDDYGIGVSFTQVASAEDGRMVQVSGSVQTYVPVLVQEPRKEVVQEKVQVEEPRSVSTAGGVLIFVLLALIILGYLYLNPKNSSAGAKNKRKSRRK